MGLVLEYGATNQELMMAKRATKKEGNEEAGGQAPADRTARATSAISGRAARGRIKESDDVSRSLSQDRHRKATETVKPWQGDRAMSPLSIDHDPRSLFRQKGPPG